jgi:hypothetical protein
MEDYSQVIHTVSGLFAQCSFAEQEKDGPTGLTRKTENLYTFAFFAFAATFLRLL